MSFAEVLKELMIEKNINQVKLAREIGYSQRAISKWINCQSEPTASAIIACAHYFNVSSDELLGLCELTLSK